MAGIDAQGRTTLHSKALTALALATGAFAFLVGAWGLIAPGEMQTPSEIQQSIRWAAAGILTAAISALSATLLYALRGRT